MSPCSTTVFTLDCHIHIGQRPWPYVYFTVWDNLFCRRFKPIDSYKETSPSGPEAKHLRPRRTPINGVVRSRETVFHIVPFSKCMYALLQNVLCWERLYISYLKIQIVQFLQTECFMKDWSLYALSFLCTLWTGYCELLKSAVVLYTGY